MGTAKAVVSREKSEGEGLVERWASGQESGSYQRRMEDKRGGITPKMRKKRCSGVGKGGRARRKDCISRHQHQGKPEDEGSSAEESAFHSPAGKRAEHHFTLHSPSLQQLLSPSCGEANATAGL